MELVGSRRPELCAHSRVNGERDRVRVLTAAYSDVAFSDGAGNRDRVVTRRIKDEDKHRAGRRNVSSGDCHYKLMNADECRHAKGTIPTHDGVSTKVHSVDCQIGTDSFPLLRR